MAKVAGIKLPPKKAPVARRKRSKVDAAWDDALKMSGAAYHKYRRRVFDSYYADKKAADVFPDLIEWMKDSGYNNNDIKRMRKHGSVGLVLIGIYTRCLRNGMPDLHPEHNAYWQTLPGTVGDLQPISIFIRKKIDEALSKIDTSGMDEEDEVVKPETARRTVQENMRDKTMEIGGEIDELFDEFAASEYKNPEKFSVMSLLRSKSCPPQTIDIISEPLKNQLSELTELMNPPTPAKLKKMSEHEKDMHEQLKEGYAHLGKLQIRAIHKFLEKAIADCASYVQVKKVERKPRAVKQKTPAQIVRKFKYLKEFADLKLTSVSAEKLVNGSEAWLYNTSTRKLIHLIADDMTQTYTIKSNTVIGYDPSKSVSKTLRKPAEQLKAFLKGGKPACRKVFQDIKATEVKYNGRGNDHVVILKAW